MTHVADKLREARALVAKGWTQGQMARGRNNAVASPHSEKARSWCSVGAILAVVHGEPTLEFRNALRGAVGCGNLVWWNDTPERTQAQVLAAFDKAIALASGTEAGTGETEGLDPKGDGPTAESGDAQDIGGPSQ